MTWLLRILFGSTLARCFRGANVPFRVFRWLVFKAGDTRWLGWRHFPFVLTWAGHENPQIDLDEAQLAARMLEPGDVILHRDRGFLGNVGIGGVMIHAGLYVGKDDKGRPQVVEAISEGVVKRSALYILHSDYACILRPKVPMQAALNAAGQAEEIVGMPYDPLFEFNTEVERAVLNAAQGLWHFKRREEFLARNPVRFCCTEIPHFCYLDSLGELGLHRKRNRTFATWLLKIIGIVPGDEIVTADMYVESHGFEMVWASKHYTPDWAAKMGASEAHLWKLRKIKG